MALAGNAIGDGARSGLCQQTPGNIPIMGQPVQGADLLLDGAPLSPLLLPLPVAVGDPIVPIGPLVVVASPRHMSVRKIPRFTIDVPQRELSISGATQVMLPPQQEESKLDVPDLNARLWLSNLSYSINEAALIKFLTPVSRTAWRFI